MDTGFKSAFIASGESVNADNLEMYKSVQKYHGFYVAWCRARNVSEDNTVKIYQSVSDVTFVHGNSNPLAYVPYAGRNGGYTLIDVGCQELADPDTGSWKNCDTSNIITTNGATTFAKMYENNRSVVSTLCYKSQWIAMAKFIKNNEITCVELGTYGESGPSGEWVLTTENDTVPTIVRYDYDTGGIIITEGANISSSEYRLLP